MASEKTEDILTSEEFAAHCQAHPELRFPDRRNIALNRGGSVDIYTDSTGTVLAVVRHVPITDAIRKEIAPLLAAAKARASAGQS